MSEVHGLVCVVASGLVDAGGSGGAGALVDGGLHLVEEVVDVEEVALGLQVGHWEGVVRLGHRGDAGAVPASSYCHQGLRGHVVNQGSALDGEAVKLHQALADLGVRRWVDAATLGITEEVIKGVKPALPWVVACVLAYVGCVLVDWVVDWPVALRLLGLVEPTVPARVVWLPIVSIGLVHLRVGVVIVTRGTGCYVHVRTREGTLVSQVWPGRRIPTFTVWGAVATDLTIVLVR